MDDDEEIIEMTGSQESWISKHIVSLAGLIITLVINVGILVWGIASITSELTKLSSDNKNSIEIIKAQTVQIKTDIKTIAGSVSATQRDVLALQAQTIALSDKNYKLWYQVTESKKARSIEDKALASALIELKLSVNTQTVELRGFDDRYIMRKEFDSRYLKTAYRQEK